MTGNVVSEKVDIEKEADELSVHSEGSLELLNKEINIKSRWLRERTVVWVSVAVILSLLVTGVVSLAYSTDPSTKDWARQLLFALMGFAAGAIWKTSSTEGS